jgi:phosphoserine phosphatase RsbU/P
LIHSKPAAPATTGGDVYYLSVCDESVSRVVLADVAGHGEAVAGTALKLRTLLKKYINMFDQSALMREINEAFRSENEDLARYATAAVLSYYCKTGVLVFANVGHPPTLWYHRNEKTWDWLDERTPHTVNVVAGLPLGLIHGTEYEQTAVHLAEGDLLILYTDGITECADAAAKELGSEGLLTLLRRMTVEPSIETADALVAAVEKFRGSTSCLDDQSVIVLQRTVGCRHVTTGWPKTNYLV